MEYLQWALYIVGYGLLIWLGICLVLLPVLIADHRGASIGPPVILLIAGFICAAYPIFWFVALIVAAVAAGSVNGPKAKPHEIS